MAHDDERALARLVDERAILDTLYRYAHSLDYGLEADWVDCFTEDAVWDSHRSPIPAMGGPEKLVRGRAELAGFAAAHTRPPEAWHKHMLCESRIDVEGDRARADSYFARLDVDVTGSFIRAFGRYRDALVRCADGRWRIESRVVEIDGTHPLAEPGSGPNVAESLWIEDIERVKARYCRLLDTKEWDRWGALFTDDAVLWCGPGASDAVAGRAAIVDRVRGAYADAGTVHQVSMPDIEITRARRAVRMTQAGAEGRGAGAARGVWGMTDVTTTATSTRTRWGHYEETYELGDDDVWRIASLRLMPLRVEDGPRRG